MEPSCNERVTECAIASSKIDAPVFGRVWLTILRLFCIKTAPFPPELHRGVGHRESPSVIRTEPVAWYDQESSADGSEMLLWCDARNRLAKIDKVLGYLAIYAAEHVRTQLVRIRSMYRSHDKPRSSYGRCVTYWLYQKTINMFMYRAGKIGQVIIISCSP